MTTAHDADQHTDREPITPLRKAAHVPQGVEEAFRLFTEEIAAWWPLATHSVGGERATSVHVEPIVGGRIVEAYGDGDTAVWGTVLAWEPPTLVRFTWHPGTPVGEATEVEVRFSPDEAGTSVELVHRGWSRRPDGAASRARYDIGWDLVFGCYADGAGGALTAHRR